MEATKEVKRLHELAVKERIATSDAYAVPEILRKPRKPERLTFSVGAEWKGWVWQRWKRKERL